MFRNNIHNISCDWLKITWKCFYERGPSEMKSVEETKRRKRRQNNLQTRLLRNSSVMKVSNLLMQEMTSHERFLLQDVDTNSESSPYNCKPRNYKTHNNNNNNNNRTICCHEIPTDIGCDDDNFPPKHSDDYHRVVMHNLPLIQHSTDLSFNHSFELNQEPRSCLICMESSSWMFHYSCPIVLLDEAILQKKSSVGNNPKQTSNNFRAMISQVLKVAHRNFWTLIWINCRRTHLTDTNSFKTFIFKQSDHSSVVGTLRLKTF